MSDSMPDLMTPGNEITPLYESSAEDVRVCRAKFFPESIMDMPKESQAAFITCTFSMLGKIACADGVVSDDEVRRIEKYIDGELKLDNKLRTLALRVFQDSLNSPLELRDYAEKFQETFPDRLRHLDRLVEILLEVSISDGKLEPKEEALIYSAALMLGLSKPAYERIRSKHHLYEPLKLPN